MNPNLHALPLDWTGSSPGNRTRGEYFDLSEQYDLPFRVAVMQNGYFYTEGMSITDSSGYLLTEDKDYKCLGFLSDVVDKTAKPVCSVLVIINPKVKSVFRVDAQMVGGEYCNLTPAIAQAALGLVNTTRKVHWANIIGKPDTFRPNGHLHALWELFGFTPQVLQLKRMVKGFEKSVQKDFDELLAGFDLIMKPYEELILVIENQLLAHIADVTTNPHRNTRAQIGLTNVMDYPKATVQDASAANADIMNRYATPYSMNVAINVNFMQKLTEHIGNSNNPHRLTASLLNIYTIAEYNSKLPSYVTVGSTMEQSNKVYGKTPQELFAALRANMNAQNLDGSVFRLIPGRYSKQMNLPGKDYYLAADQNWYLISSAVTANSSTNVNSTVIVYLPAP